MEIDEDHLVTLWREGLKFEQIAVKMKTSVLKVKRELRKLYLID